MQHVHGIFYVLIGWVFIIDVCIHFSYYRLKKILESEDCVDGIRNPLIRKVLGCDLSKEDIHVLSNAREKSLARMGFWNKVTAILLLLYIGIELHLSLRTGVFDFRSHYPFLLVSIVYIEFYYLYISIRRIYQLVLKWISGLPA